MFFTFIRFIFHREQYGKKPNRFNIIGTINNKIVRILDYKQDNDMYTSDIIDIAIQNLNAKKNRTYVTIMGMAIGFGAVVLLLSIGYGFEKLVISEVASLKEMQQIDVSVSQGSPVVINAEIISKVLSIEGVQDAIPIITLVSKVGYNNAVSDVITYAVPTSYFEQEDINPISGSLFNVEYKPITQKDNEDGSVAGAKSKIISSDKLGEEVSKIRYSINPLEWIPVYSRADDQAYVLGYTKRETGNQEAIEVIGKGYREDNSEEKLYDYTGNYYSRWIVDEFPLWTKGSCKLNESDCFEGVYKVVKNGDTQSRQKGYIKEHKISFERYDIHKYDNSNKNGYIDDVYFSFKSIDSYLLNTSLENNDDVISLNVINNNELIEGSLYSSASNISSYWVKSKLEVIKNKECKDDCKSYDLISTDDQRDSIVDKLYIEVYIKMENVNIKDSKLESIMSGNVLGATDTSVLGESEGYIDIDVLKDADKSIDWVSLSNELGESNIVLKDVKDIPDTAQKAAIVNVSMLQLLGLSPNDAEGKTFNSTFIYDSKLFNKNNYIVESEKVDYKIVGVVSDSRNPTFYVPISDVMVEDLVNYSALKVVIDSKDMSYKIRKEFENMGFQTKSVVDTVDGISGIFSYLRIGLLVIGLIALGVASLGMFNTLTVSLMEKTREVGLLKTMGMKTGEIKHLFLAESMIMSMAGGVTGLVIGFLLGQLISLAISTLSLSQGAGYLNITYIPYALVLAIVIASFVVGVITGWYPAKRATGISALNALRYE